MRAGEQSGSGALRAAVDQSAGGVATSRLRQRGPAAAARPSAAPPLAAFELIARIDEEISRASRHRDSLCCLLVQITNLPQLVELHGEAFAAHALQHVGDVLRVELRRYDRVGHPLHDELVIVLPGAALSQGEAVARRALRRLRAIKVEIERVRQPLAISIGIAAWSEPWSAERLIEEARTAASAGACATVER
ncbi:MAG: diguanylate cyclase domain-containing protein [Solirubrobacteraceae bacterium]